MELELSDDQELLLDTARRYLDASEPLARVRQLLDDPVGFDRGAWAQRAELGWLGLVVPVERGGYGGPAGVAEAALVAEALGRLVQPGPFVATTVAAAALAGDVRRPAPDPVLEALMGGEAVVAWAPTAATLTARATAAGGLRLDGVVPGVQDAEVADHLLLGARLGDGWVTVLVAGRAPGVTYRRLDGLDLTRRHADVVVAGAELPAAAVVEGHPPDALFDLAVTLQVAETVGAADRLMEMTVEYARERIAFGRPIGSYQAIKHRLADLLLLLEASKAASVAATRAVAHGQDDASLVVSTAKAYVAEASVTVAEEALQVHGGIGFTWDHDLHLYFRRIKANSVLLGAPAWHRQRIAGLLGLPHGSGGMNAASTDPTAFDEDAFRAEARAWLAANLPRQSEVPRGTADDELAQVARAQELQALLYGAGYAGLTYPVAYGGRGLPARAQEVFDEEAAGYEGPTLLRVPTLGIIAPTLLAHASPEQKAEYLPPLLRGEELWVQLLSEPSGGSDLAGLLTRAERDGDTYVVNGQKVWSTGAHYVDYGLLLARTDADVPKHRGLTMLVVPLRSPGVTIAPIRQINGEAEFCEVFFDDVAVPAEHIVGDRNEGWAVATTLLGFERRVAGVGRPADVVGDAIRFARARGLDGDPRVAQLVAGIHVRNAVEGWLLQRISTATRLGLMPVTANSLLKLYRSGKAQGNARATFELAAELGGGGVLWPTAEADGGPEDGDGERWAYDYLTSRARSIAGGTNEMQRNVISERVLGLPREPPVDRDLPFREVRQNRTSSRSDRGS